ncbi:import component protein [Myroides odoratus]|uniref:import component protein n=1 Tax=Myroides odoratus TaxID=256 RepID=UPI000765FA52|nr:import component protein [Myroides odoratus]
MNNKILSIISYITLIGWLVAYFIGKEKADDLLKYHLKQALGVLIIAIVFNIIVSIIVFMAPFLSFIGYFGIIFLVFIILGIVRASNSEKTPLPLIGKWFENSFKFID